MMTAEIEIRRVEVEKILDLRHRILRAGLPPESARFEGDEAETTRHFAAISIEGAGRAGGQIIACLSLMLNSYEGEPAWQLRGMAVEEGWQQRGLGRQLLTQAEAAAESEDRARLLWCNARLPAVGFYQKQGWAVVSEVFEIPTAGPHVRMRKGLKSANPRSIVEKPDRKR